MTTYTPSQLVNIEWKPYTDCTTNGISSKEQYTKTLGCEYCSGTGKEPVEMKNELTCEHGEEDGQYCSGCSYRYKVGVEFEVYGWKKNKIYKFLPLHPKVEGDNSVLMVVPR